MLHRSLQSERFRVRAFNPRVPGNRTLPTAYNGASSSALKYPRMMDVAESGSAALDRAKLNALLEEADVVIEGSRPYHLEKYALAPGDLTAIPKKRGYGIIHVRENCHGWNRPWQKRTGWQQISDACTGVSWAFSQAVGVDEPITPVFPNSDYCTGISGAIAVIQALMNRSIRGGSFRVDVALNYYNVWLVKEIGVYPKDVWNKLWSEKGAPKLRYYTNMGQSLPRYMGLLARHSSHLFHEAFFEDRKAFNGLSIRAVKPVVQYGNIVQPGYRDRHRRQPAPRRTSEQQTSQTTLSPTSAVTALAIRQSLETSSAEQVQDNQSYSQHSAIDIDSRESEVESIHVTQLSTLGLEVPSTSASSRLSPSSETVTPSVSSPLQEQSIASSAVESPTPLVIDPRVTVSVVPARRPRSPTPASFSALDDSSTASTSTQHLESPSKRQKTFSHSSNDPLAPLYKYKTPDMTYHANGISTDEKDVPSLHNGSTSEGAKDGLLDGDEEDVQTNGFGSEQRNIELVRIILQTLREMGYSQSASILEEESGYLEETPSVVQFREAVLDGDWDKVETLVEKFQQEGDEDDQVDGEPDSGKLVKFVIRQQKYLELIEAGHVEGALRVLQYELTPLGVAIDKVHALSSLMMCSTPAELGRRAKLAGVHEMSRQALMLELQKHIPSSTMIPPSRLNTLMKQALQYQVTQCLYHNGSEEPVSLLVNHICDRSQFPTRTIHILSDHNDEVWYIAFSADGRYLASASSDRTCIIWRTDTWQVYRHFTGHQKYCSYCAWSPDSSKLLTVGEDTIKLWDVEQGTCLRTLTKQDDPGCCVWLPDGKRFITSGLRDNNMLLWSLTGEVLYKWTGIRASDLAVNGGGTRLYATSRSKVFSVYSLETLNNDPLWSTAEKEHITSLRLSADSTQALLNIAGADVYLYNVETRQLVHKYTGHQHSKLAIRSCLGGAGETYVVSGNDKIYVWHKDYERLIETLSGHSGPVNSVCWAPHQPYMFASASDDRTIRIWGLPTQADKGKMAVS
ncbi:hypothetical protein BZG36_01055 [Bifiguratus adelaidae]|uniref:CTLH domain-containing protein n=1 Tax=Bifiguratus adelaidae TaxID=1938954 RepID=A0A261Y692_9FUNG|nr:hypothetical protein BZG36_01055 [Bifiguratus adelaidae]